MVTVDLTTVSERPQAAPRSPISGALLDVITAAPRRLGLTLPELQHAASLAGGAPLPFDVAPPTASDAMQARLGQSPTALDDEAYRSVVSALHDPAESLARRGLLADGRLDSGLAGAIGLLAAPHLALDLDITAAGVQARAWHRQAGSAVASLATADGIVFEVAWFAVDAWAAELARVAMPSGDVEPASSVVPSYVDLPFELADAAAEAAAAGRGDLLPVLAGRYAGQVLGSDGPLPDSEVVRVLTALAGEAQGRLRALAADVSGPQVRAVGVVSWTLLADGWHSVRPHEVAGVARVELSRVDPADLAGLLAPVLAPVRDASEAAEEVGA